MHSPDARRSLHRAHVPGHQLTAGLLMRRLAHPEGTRSPTRSPQLKIHNVGRRRVHGPSVLDPLPIRAVTFETNQLHRFARRRTGEHELHGLEQFLALFVAHLKQEGLASTPSEDLLSFGLE